MPGPVGAEPEPHDRRAGRPLRRRDARGRARARTGAGAPGRLGRGRAAGRGAAGRAERGRVSFTEEMKGYLDFEETDYEARLPRRQGRRAQADVPPHDHRRRRRALHRRPSTTRRGSRAGCGCDALGGSRPVEGGHFNLFVDQDGDRRHKRMYYRLLLPRRRRATRSRSSASRRCATTRASTSGRDTSTLYTRVLAGHVAAGRGARGARCSATAILHILPRDFARQMTTFRVRPARRVDALAPLRLAVRRRAVGDLRRLAAR